VPQIKTKNTVSQKNCPGIKEEPHSRSHRREGGGRKTDAARKEPELKVDRTQELPTPRRRILHKRKEVFSKPLRKTRGEKNVENMSNTVWSKILNFPPRREVKSGITPSERAWSSPGERD